MEAIAIGRNMRITPRKARLVIDLIRGKNVATAIGILTLLPHHSSRIVEKILRSAVANAEQKQMGDVDKLRVSTAYVDSASFMKRFMPRAMGRSAMIKKRTSHITVVLSNEKKKKNS